MNMAYYYSGKTLKNSRVTHVSFSELPCSSQFLGLLVLSQRNVYLPCKAYALSSTFQGLNASFWPKHELDAHV
jgi:hypothetical protein